MDTRNICAAWKPAKARVTVKPLIIHFLSLTDPVPKIRELDSASSQLILGSVPVRIVREIGFGIVLSCVDSTAIGPPVGLWANVPKSIVSL